MRGVCSECQTEHDVEHDRHGHWVMCAHEMCGQRCRGSGYGPEVVFDGAGGLTDVAEAEILDFYGVDSIAELVDQEGNNMMDSVVDAFCTECGAYADSLEPDYRGGLCEECGANAVASLTEIVLFGGLA